MLDTDKAIQIARDLAVVVDQHAYAGGQFWCAEADGPRYEHDAVFFVDGYGADHVAGDASLRAAVIVELDEYIAGERARVAEEREEVEAIQAEHEADRRRGDKEYMERYADCADQHR